MDRNTLPPDHLSAGAEYRDRLRGLGLDPEGLLWAYDETFGGFVLVLVTTHVDHAGPLALYELLTHAYNASETPRLIDPFIVRLHSPRQWIVRELRAALKWDIEFDSADPAHTPPGVMVTVAHTRGDLSFQGAWVYQLRDETIAPVDRTRRWKRFRDRVEALPVAA